MVIPERRLAFQRFQTDQSRARSVDVLGACVTAGLDLPPGSCYFFKVPATMGGAYDPSNIASVPMTEFYPYLRSLHDQTKYLPDNTQIRLRVK